MAAAHGKPVCIVWITELLAGPGSAEAEAAEHVALFRSMSSCFAALAAWTERAARLAAPPAAPAPTPPSVRAEAAALIAAAGGRTLTERAAKAALALYGVPVVGETPGADGGGSGGRGRGARLPGGAQGRSLPTCRTRPRPA